MRLWMVDPAIMCRKHLLGEHLETHMFAGAIRKGTGMTGYADKNLLEVESLQDRHDRLVAEMKVRHINHDSPFVPLTEEEISHVPKVEIDRSQARADLLVRCDECRARYTHLTRPPAPGWIGRMDQVTYYLSTVGADYTEAKDKDGKPCRQYHIGHPENKGGIFSFLRMDSPTAEVVIDSETVYFIEGHPAGLAAGLGSTSYGLRVQVIC